MKKISAVIPMYYEEEVAQECYNRMKETLKSIDNYNYEIIFINDGSKDRTLDILKTIAQEDKNVKIISFSRNFGHQCAVTAGLKYVTGDAIVIIDADLQDPPELIPEMLKLWMTAQHNIDVLCISFSEKVCIVTSIYSKLQKIVEKNQKT